METPEYLAVVESIATLRKLQVAFDELTADLSPATFDHPAFVCYSRVGAAFAVLGSLADADIMAAAFLVMMQATKSAQQDLKDVMAGVASLLEKRDALGDALTKMIDELGKLSPRLRDLWNTMPDEAKNASISSVTEVHVLRPVGSASGKPLPLTGIVLQIAAEGDLTAELDCASDQYVATLTIRDLLKDEAVASKSGNANLLSVSAHFDARTVVQVEATIPGLSPFELLKCKLRVVYPKIQRGTHALTKDDRALMASTISSHDSAAQDLLNAAAAMRGAANVQDGISSLVSRRCGYVSVAGSFADFDTVADEWKNEAEQLSELGEEQQLRMQMLMDRMQKADSAVSNAMKKFSEVTSQIIGNMK